MLKNDSATDSVSIYPCIEPNRTIRIAYRTILTTMIIGLSSHWIVYPEGSLLKRKKCDGKHNFLERLLGATRLLAQMVEPMMKAATEISILLARSFFMSFSVTVLAVLGRLRVLVQQILLDVVSVFNTVSTLSQKAQSVKLSQEGFEVFREYYPIHERTVTLDCVWETDKFVLLERINEPSNKDSDADTREDVSLGGSAVQYQSIETVLGDDLSKPSEENPANLKEDNTTTTTATNTSSLEATVPQSDDSKQKDEDGYNEENNSGLSIGPPGPEGNWMMSSTSSLPLKRKSGLGSKVAFVSVKRPAPSTVKETGGCVEETKSNKEDPFFSLLTGGSGKP